MWKFVSRALGIVACLALVSSSASAQSGTTISGTVKDTSGAVLPGVTVEVASPALIEKVRTAVTDNDGRYSVVSLRPGVYSVTFTLPGFGTVKRDEIELTSDFTAQVNAEIRVGTLQETITVTAESLIVDTQGITQSVPQRVSLSTGCETLRLLYTAVRHPVRRHVSVQPRCPDRRCRTEHPGQLCHPVRICCGAGSAAMDWRWVADSPVDS